MTDMMKGWWIGGTAAGIPNFGTAKWFDDYKLLAEEVAHRFEHLKYLQVWNEMRAFYDTRAGHANNKLLARHRQRRHK